MIKIVQHGDFHRTDNYFQKMLRTVKLSRLDRYGKMGVDALKDATPVDTGETAESWFYTIERTKNSISISWRNSNENEGAVVAILIQYGHSTGTGGYVSGTDFVNPALKPVFAEIAEDLWREVSG